MPTQEQIKGINTTFDAKVPANQSHHIGAANPQPQTPTPSTFHSSSRQPPRRSNVSSPLNDPSNNLESHAPSQLYNTHGDYSALHNDEADGCIHTGSSSDRMPVIFTVTIHITCHQFLLAPNFTFTIVLVLLLSISDSCPLQRNRRRSRSRNSRGHRPTCAEISPPIPTCTQRRNSIGGTHRSRLRNIKNRQGNVPSNVRNQRSRLSRTPSGNQ